MVFLTFVAVNAGAEKRGHLVDWVEKASFDCLSKLFEIDAKERQCKTLLTARNLTAVVREPQEYVINILPRKMPNEVVLGEHYIVKDLPIYEASKEADAEKLWTRIFHVRPNSIGETRFLFVKN